MPDYHAADCIAVLTLSQQSLIWTLVSGSTCLAYTDTGKHYCHRGGSQDRAVGTIHGRRENESLNIILVSVCACACVREYIMEGGESLLCVSANAFMCVYVYVCNSPIFVIKHATHSSGWCVELHFPSAFRGRERGFRPKGKWERWKKKLAKKLEILAGQIKHENRKSKFYVDRSL